jgi:hypothetical protein
VSILLRSLLRATLLRNSGACREESIYDYCCLSGGNREKSSITAHEGEDAVGLPALRTLRVIVA